MEALLNKSLCIHTTPTEKGKVVVIRENEPVSGKTLDEFSRIVGSAFTLSGTTVIAMVPSELVGIVKRWTHEYERDAVLWFYALSLNSWDFWTPTYLKKVGNRVVVETRLANFVYLDYECLVREMSHESSLDGWMYLNKVICALRGMKQTAETKQWLEELQKVYTKASMPRTEEDFKILANTLEFCAALDNTLDGALSKCEIPPFDWALSFINAEQKTVEINLAEKPGEFARALYAHTLLST